MDAVAELRDVHEAIQRAVDRLLPTMRALDPASTEFTPLALRSALGELSESMLDLFAREEGLMPFLAEHVPEMVSAAREVLAAHDQVSGALARLVHQTKRVAVASTLRRRFEHFASLYIPYAGRESQLIASLLERLTPEQRAALSSALVAATA